MLHVIDYFAKSIKVTQVIQNDTLEKGVIFHCNYVCIFRTVSEIFSVK